MPTKHPEKIDITFATFMRLFSISALVVVAYYLLEVIIALLFAVVIASAIEPAVQWAKKYRISRLAAIVMIYLFAAVFFLGAVYLVFPAIAGELQNFLSSYPIYLRELFREIESFTGIPVFNLFIENGQELVAVAPDAIQQFASGTFQFAAGIFGGVAMAFITVVISFYLAAQEKGIENFLRLVSPLEYEEYAVDLWLRSQHKMGQWFRAQLFLGAIIGVLVYVALAILGIRYRLAFALFAALLEIVPVIGPIIAAVPAVVVAFVQGPLLGLIVMVVYFVIQQVESHLIVPTVMRRAIGLNPLVVIIALLAGGALGGVPGLFLAVPIASVVVEFLTDTDRKKRGVFQYGGGG